MSFAYGTKIVNDGLVFYLDAANPNCYKSGDTTTNSIVSENICSVNNGENIYSYTNGFLILFIASTLLSTKEAYCL